MTLASRGQYNLQRRASLAPLGRIAMCKRAVLLAVICGFLCAAADAADTSAPMPKGDSDKHAPIEEVTVEAHKEKLSQLRLEIKKSVDDFYDAFNKANTVPEY